MKLLCAQFCNLSKLESLSFNKHVLPVYSAITKEQLRPATLAQVTLREGVDISPTSP